MIGRTEIDFSRTQIEKAERRLSYQCELVRRLGPDNRSQYAALACELVVLMRRRLAMLVDQRDAMISTINRASSPPRGRWSEPGRYFEIDA